MLVVGCLSLCAVRCCSVFAIVCYLWFDASWLLVGVRCSLFVVPCAMCVAWLYVVVRSWLFVVVCCSLYLC